MKPEHDVRRKVIREWMSLPRDKRQTQGQAAAFAMKAAETRAIAGSREDSYRRILSRLLPRTEKTQRWIGLSALRLTGRLLADMGNPIAA